MSDDAFPPSAVQDATPAVREPAGTSGAASLGLRPGGARRALGAAADWTPAAAIAVALVAAWEAAVHLLDIQRWLLPPPSAILQELVEARALLWRHTLVTLEEVLIGFAVATGAGILLAIGIAYSRLIERSVYPFVIASQTIPIITIAPLLLVWVGPDKTSKVIVVALITFFPIVVNLVDGLRSADPAGIDMFRTLGASRWQIFTRLQIPSSLPYFFSGLKVASVVAVIGAVIGEWVGARAGLGWLMRLSTPLFQTERVFAAIVLLSVMAILLFTAINVIERWALRRHRRGAAV